MSSQDRRDLQDKEKQREAREKQRSLEPEYEDIPFDKYRTDSIRKQHQEYYPRKNDSRQLRKYLETERSLVSKPDRRREENEMAREYVTRDNREAHNHRRESNVSARDMAYSRDHPLHDGYKSYKTKRDSLHREQEPNREERRR